MFICAYNAVSATFNYVYKAESPSFKFNVN